MKENKFGFWRVFLDEVKYIFRTPMKLFWCLGIPLMIFMLYASIFGDGVLRDLPLAILDEDKSVVSRDLVRQLDANATMQFTEDINTETEAMKLIRTSKVFGVVIIPNNLEKDMSIGKPVNVVLYINNNYLTPAGLIYKAFNTTIGTFATTAKVNTLMKTGASTLQAKVSVQQVEVGSHTLFNPYINYAYYLCLSLFPMALQMTVMVNTLYTLGSILKYNQGKSLYKKSGENVWNAYWGKILPYTFLFSILAMVMVLYLFKYMHIPINTSITKAYLLTLMLILVYQLIAVFFVTILKDFRTLCSIGGGYSALAFSFSGYTFPQDGMPTGIKILDMIFPFASYARMLTNTAVKGMPITSSYNYLLGFVLFALIGLLSLKKFSFMLQKGSYEK